LRSAHGKIYGAKILLTSGISGMRETSDSKGFILDVDLSRLDGMAA
jgi:hypothetical protein